MRIVTDRKSLKIFIVEDEELFASLLRDFLIRTLSDDVEVFPTGEACIESLGQNPDVIIIDYYLNSRNKNAADGLEILRRIRNSGNRSRIIILSGQTEFGVAMQSRFDGAQHYVIKDEKAFERIQSLIVQDPTVH